MVLVHRQGSRATERSEACPLPVDAVRDTPLWRPAGRTRLIFEGGPGARGRGPRMACQALGSGATRQGWTEPAEAEHGQADERVRVAEPECLTGD